MSGTTSERSNTGVRGGGGSGAGNGSMTIDIRPMIEDVSQVMTKHITNILSGVIGEYTVYKETHDTIMGLPCVRKLQERIYELEQHSSGGDGQPQHQQTQNTSSREDEISQLQSAIVDLNRYIHALESRVDMKNVSGGTTTTTTAAASSGGHDEESVRLEVHENDNQSGDESGEEEDEAELEEEECLHKNVIITSDALETVVEAGDDEDAVDETAEEEEAEEEEAPEEAVEEAAEEDAEEVDAHAEADEEDEEADEEEAEEDAEAAEENADDADAEAEEEEEEEAEEEEEVEEVVAAEPEEETEEVEEVIIKGKTYFTTNPQNGIIYACVDDDVGNEVGVFKNGVAVFNKGKK